MHYSDKKYIPFLLITSLPIMCNATGGHKNSRGFATHSFMSRITGEAPH